MRYLIRSIFIYLLFAVLLFVPNTFAQSQTEDVVYTKDGSIIHGTIIEQIPGVSLKIQTYDGNVFSFEMDEIEKFTKEPVEKEKGKSGKEENKGYLTLGSTLGTPAGLNFVLGRTYKNFGSRISGGYWGSYAGYQVNAFYKFSDTEKFTHDISIMFGGSVVDDNEWDYIGLAYALNAHGFFFELGLDVGTGDYSNPQLGFQIGYIHRFQ